MCKKLFDWSHLNISNNGMRIIPSLETLFLGLTLDCRLKWNSHISNKIAAAKRAFFTEVKSEIHLGQNKQRLKFLYDSAVEPILLYCCSIWAPFLNTKKVSSSYAPSSALLPFPWPALSKLSLQADLPQSR